MKASYSTAWTFQLGIMLGTAWMNPAEAIIRREIALACSRLQLDASRYSLTVDPRLQGVLHTSLAAVMPTRGKSGRSAFLDGRSAARHRAANRVVSTSGGSSAVHTAARVQDSSMQIGGSLPLGGPGVNPVAPLPQQWSISDPALTAWEKRLHQNTITIEDLATAMMRTSAEDASNTLGFAGFTVYFLGLAITLIPFATLASWRVLGQFDASPIHIAANVCLMISTLYSLASCIMFMNVALADYLRRARIQFVLFQLTRSISSNLAASGISIFKATALTQFNRGLAGSSPHSDIVSESHQSTADTEAQGNRDLQSVIEAAAGEDQDEDSDSLSLSSAQSEARSEHTIQAPDGATSFVRLSHPPPVSANVVDVAEHNSGSVAASHDAASIANAACAPHGAHSTMPPLKSAPFAVDSEPHLSLQNKPSWEAVVVSSPAPHQQGSLVGGHSHHFTADSSAGQLRSMAAQDMFPAPAQHTLASSHPVQVVLVSTPDKAGRTDLPGPATEHTDGPVSISGNPGGESMDTMRLHSHSSTHGGASSFPGGAALHPLQGESVATAQPPASLQAQVGLRSELQADDGLLPSQPAASVGTVAGESKQHPLLQEMGATPVAEERSFSEESERRRASSGAASHAESDHEHAWRRRRSSGSAPQVEHTQTESAGNHNHHQHEAQRGGARHGAVGLFQSPTTTFIARLGTQLGGGVFSTAASTATGGGAQGADGQSSIDNSACGLPPVVDVTRPSNAFAWFKLKELLGETGVRFQLRVQVYLGVFALCTLLLDIAALVEVLNTPGRLGHDTGTDMLAAAAFVHTALLVAFILLCILLGAYSNSQADQQAEALTRAELELEEVARDLMLEVEHRTVAQAYTKQSAGTGVALDNGAPPVLFAASVRSLPEHATAVPIPPVRRTLSNASGWSAVEPVRGVGNKSALSGVVKHMSLQHLAALLSGIRSAVGTLSGVIRALRVNRDAHPVRIMGFPASYTMARVLITLLLTAASLLAGNSLTRTAEE